MSKDEDDLAYEERLKSALWYWTGKFVDEECLALNVNATQQFIGSLTEMIWAQLENVGKDVESFSKHANRGTITTADALLLARKNVDLHKLLEDFVEKEKASRVAAATGTKGKGRAT